MRSAVILAGGNSRRLGAEKSLLEFGGKPLICWTTEKLNLAADEVIVVARSKDHAEHLKKLAIEAVFAWDSIEGYGPVAGLDAGMKCARGSLVFATGCDLPFLNLEVIEKLFDLAYKEESYDATVPLRPNGYVEPLHSGYNREKMLFACQRALEEDERRIRAPLSQLRINSVPIEWLQPLDPELLTFFNLNTPMDLEKARGLWPKGKA
jgi:molybdopterin-guanine dinucleotide biosynthesis protein A